MDFVDIDWEYPTAVREPDKCDNKNDESKLFRFNFFGDTADAKVG